MIVKRLLFLVMAICLASGVKAQFYDEPNDIYYYYSEKADSHTPQGYGGHSYYNWAVIILNFDGKRACHWSASISDVKRNIKNNPNYYEDETENQDYSNLVYYSSLTYKWGGDCSNPMYFKFSADRSTLTLSHYKDYTTKYIEFVYKRVDKSFFKVGRSGTPSGTIYE